MAESQCTKTDEGGVKRRQARIPRRSTTEMAYINIGAQNLPLLLKRPKKPHILSNNVALNIIKTLVTHKQTQNWRYKTLYLKPDTSV